MTYENNSKAVDNNLIFYQLNQIFEKSLYYKYFKILLNHTDQFKTVKESIKTSTLNLLENNKITYDGKFVKEFILDLSEGLIEFKNKSQLNNDIDENVMIKLISNKDKPKYSKNNRTYILNKKFVKKPPKAKWVYGHENDSKAFLIFLEISKTYNPQLFKIDKLNLDINSVIVKNDNLLSLDTTISYFKSLNIKEENIKAMLDNKITLSKNSQSLINDSENQTGYLWFIYNNQHMYINITMYHYILNSLFYGYKEHHFIGGIAQVLNKIKTENLKINSLKQLQNKQEILKINNTIYNIDKMNNMILPEDIGRLNNKKFRSKIIKYYDESDEILNKKAGDYKDVDSIVVGPISHFFESLTNYQKFNFFIYDFNVDENNPIKINEKIKNVKDSELIYGNIKIFDDEDIINLIDVLTPKINFLIEYINLFKCHIVHNVAVNTAAFKYNMNVEDVLDVTRHKDLKTYEDDKHYTILAHIVLLYYIFTPYHKMHIKFDNNWLFNILFLLNFYHFIFINEDNKRSNNIKPQLNNKLAVLYSEIHNLFLSNFYQIDNYYYCDCLSETCNQDYYFFYDEGEKEYKFYFGDTRVFMSDQLRETQLLIQYALKGKKFNTFEDLKTLKYYGGEFVVSEFADFLFKN